MKRLIITIFSLLLLHSLMGNPLARIYQVDDPLLSSIEELSMESGMNPHSSTGPVSGYELYRQLKKIQQAGIEPSNRKLFDEIRTALTIPYSNRIWKGSLDISQEVYWNSNPDNSYYDWAESYSDRRPLLYGEIETIFGNHVYGIISYALQKAFREVDFKGLASNNPYILNNNITAVQNSVPHTAFIGLSSEWYTLVFGRDTLSYGRGSTGNLMVGDQAPYHDFFQASLSNTKVKYTFLAIPMNELITDFDSSALGEAWYPHLNPWGSWHTLFHGTLSRTYISHRVEIDFLPWLRIAVTEGTLFYVDSLDMRMLSPLMFMHNFQNFGEVNNTMGVEAEITLSKNWKLDMQILLDQFQTGGEQDTSDPIPPNAYAGLVGARYQFLRGNWHVHGFIEGVYTSPFAYLRTGDSTGNFEGLADTQFNLDLVHAVNMEEGKSGVTWLGYTYGPDSIVLASEANLEHRSGTTLSGSLRFIVQGERGLHIEDKIQKVELQPADNINMLSPSGDDPQYSLIIGLGASSYINTKLNIYSRNYWLNRWNNSGYASDIQVIIGATYSL